MRRVASVARSRDKYAKHTSLGGLGACPTDFVTPTVLKYACSGSHLNPTSTIIVACS